MAAPPVSPDMLGTGPGCVNCRYETGSLKAGAWTIQHGQAMQMYEQFAKLGDERQQSQGIVVGVFYGHRGLLTNKYRIV